MDDYRKKIIETVLQDPYYKEASKDLPADQREKITKILTDFVDNFSMGLLRSFGAYANVQNQKAFDNLSGSVITKENG